MDRIPKLGLDFGGVISLGHTVDELVNNVVECVCLLREQIFKENIWIVSRVDNEESRRRVLKYMKSRYLWDRMGISDKNIRFCVFRCDKAPICRELGITHFVDDHTEVLSYMDTVPHRYALNTTPEELAEYPPIGMHYCQGWYDIVSRMLPTKDTKDGGTATTGQ